VSVIFPEWPTPNNIKAFYTTRTEGLSLGDYDAFNLGAHVDDNTNAVKQNRLQLKRQLEQISLRALSIDWLDQQHTTRIARFESLFSPNANRIADAVITHIPQQVCAVLTADCLPILLCDQSGTEVASVHAGWRGLAGGILLKTVAEFTASNSELLCFLGPAIGAAAFEVGENVRQAFLNMPFKYGLSEVKQYMSDHTDWQNIVNTAFQPIAQNENVSLLRYNADLYALARAQLNMIGIYSIYGGEQCTFSQPEQFYSYRRDGQTGRMATGIWIERSF